MIKCNNNKKELYKSKLQRKINYYACKNSKEYSRKNKENGKLMMNY